MTSEVLDARAVRPLPAALVLGWQEGRRIVQHPLAVLGLLLTLLPVLVVGDDGPRDAFDVLSVGPGAYYGVFVYFAAWAVASRDRRTHARELLAPAPVPANTRVAGLCVATLVPAAVCALVVLSVHAMQTARDLYVVAPSAGHLAQPVATVLGGALLGVMVARLTRLPGAALLAMITMIALDVWLVSLENGALLGTFMTWTVYADGPEWTSLNPGSAGWHSAYLLSLCAMAACGALLRESPRPARVLLAGAVCTLTAVVTGLLQLP